MSNHNREDGMAGDVERNKSWSCGSDTMRRSGPVL